MTDLLVIGSGPAGVSAAVYALRAGLSVTMLAKDGGALGKTEMIENYYGFEEPVSGAALLENGEKQAVRLGAALVRDEVVGLGFNGNLVANGLRGTYEARAAILATGASRVTPPVPGLREFEGAGVSYCAVCDAFFYRGKDVAVLGNGQYALHEAAELLPVAGSVTLLTDGMPVPGGLPEGLKADGRKLQAVEGDKAVAAARFADGDSLPIAGVFIAVGVAGSDALARKLGALTEGNRIVVDADMATNVPGLFAAGDCTGGLKQIVKAVHEGAVAGMSAAKYVRSLK
ncbi:FAD-dependent oxidoreductase [Intestinibacillus massiliensis]|nr:FAD-dependent oxidoreductase [Intestinibacillus massiliensis]